MSFTRPLEPLGRRVAADAERAYAQLSRELYPPRGTIDVLITDDFDFSNGSAVTYPTNRIIVYAMPPMTDFGLRYTTDWAQMVVTHELTHIFHLDRVRGVWRLGQYVFGRSPFLFPNIYQPSWLIEGLAVYEESHLAGQGRIEGPEHELLVRAAALDHRFPGIGDASLARPTFPQGNAAYGYGSLFMDYLARTRGGSSIRRLVESSSAQLIPYLINIPARSAFGMGFGAAWNEWRRSVEDSLKAHDERAHAPMPAWKDLTSDQLGASFPRWLTPDTLTFTGTTGREALAAYRVTESGATSRIGVRQGFSPTVRLPSGDMLFAQFEYTSPYEYRSDLFLQAAGGRPRRLTTGERLFTPDARADGAIVAMQTVDGATRVVRVSAAGRVTPITPANADTLYAEPRWSHSGDRVTATRSIRGGVTQIVVLDSTGGNLRVLVSARQLMMTPSWTPGDSAVAFTTGVDAWRVEVSSGAIRRVSTASSGILDPEYRDSQAMAAVTIGADGYRLGIGRPEPSAVYSSVAFNTTDPDPRLPPLAIDSSPARKYSALRQLRPRYWVPLAEQGTDGGYLIGGYTEAWDILRRHYLYVDAKVPTDNTGIDWSFEHQYRGLGRPVITTDLSQTWTPQGAFRGPRRIGTLDRRVNDGEILSSFVRQRYRSMLSLSAGAGVERVGYTATPDSVQAIIDTISRYNTTDVPRLTLATSYARYYTPAYSISAEDGFSVGVTARERFTSGSDAGTGPSTSVVGQLALFKALDLPGYAHHVLAVRGSAGWADTRTNGYFAVGGASGGTYQVFPGYTVGEGRRTFPVRGFEPGAARGIRAATGSVEYRAPLSLTQHGFGTLPVFLQRSAVTLFSDYGIAWCPSSDATRQVCFDPSEVAKRRMASVGGELSINAGILSWDAPTRLRLGLAKPVLNGAQLASRQWTAYFTTGVSF